MTNEKQSTGTASANSGVHLQEIPESEIERTVARFAAALVQAINSGDVSRVLAILGAMIQAIAWHMGKQGEGR